MKLGDLFNSLRGRRDSSDDEPARFAAPRQVARSANPFPYHAVSIRPGLMSCPKSLQLRGRRFLSRMAPSIPLPACPMAHECTCNFQKHNDRRSAGDRRLFGNRPDVRFFSGTERRRPGGRRSADPRPHAS